MKRLIELICQSAERLREFHELSKEYRMAELALRREIRLHLYRSIKLYWVSRFRRIKNWLKGVLTKQ